MTLESYRNFVTIVECGSILAAANQLLIAQPSLSNQLKNIETYYGAKLLIRNRHKLELTDAGRVFYLHAREICQAEEKLHNEIHNKRTDVYKRQDLSDTRAKCRIGTAKFFTLLLLLYHTSIKSQGIKHLVSSM